MTVEVLQQSIACDRYIQVYTGIYRYTQVLADCDNEHRYSTLTSIHILNTSGHVEIIHCYVERVEVQCMYVTNTYTGIIT